MRWTLLRKAAWLEYRDNPCETYEAFQARFEVNGTLSFRPDVCIFVAGSLATEQRWSSRSWTGYEGSKVAHIVEIGYTREGLGRAKLLEKSSQHLLF